jgi:thiol:disulfide interchange protein DsbD
MLLCLLPVPRAQVNNVLSVGEIAPLHLKRGATVEQKVTLELRPGFHVNSNKPNDEFLIPLKLTWTSSGIDAGTVDYPAPRLEKSDFSTQPLSVFDGTFAIVTHFHAPDSAAAGAGVVKGKLRYQACNNRECLQPKTIDITVPYEVE